MTCMIRHILFICLLIACAAPAVAQTAPVEISADHSLEWNRKAKAYTARGNASATQGNMTVRADTLTAHYNSANGSTDISRLTAAGNVTIASPPYTAHGDSATYDTATGNAVMTGQNLRIKTTTETVTATDKIEFFSSQNRLLASGSATATRGADTLSANSISAYFKPGTGGGLALDRLTADGAVTIKTARETVTGDTGVYDIGAGKATLTGTVRIFQGESLLEGTRAEVDLKTGISQLFSNAGATSATGDGRVKGVFYPKKK
jgi:lipopolysaccharide export system protein LptA